MTANMKMLNNDKKMMWAYDKTTRASFNTEFTLHSNYVKNYKPLKRGSHEFIQVQMGEREASFTGECQGWLVNVEGIELEEKKNQHSATIRVKTWIRGELSKDSKFRGILTRSSIYARS